MGLGARQVKEELRGGREVNLECIWTERNGMIFDDER